MSTADVRPNRLGRPKSFERDEVLDVAIQVFIERGYEATSVQDLVDAMGINRFSLYDTFGDKHHLFLEALDRYQAKRRAYATELLERDGPKVPLLKEYYRGIFEESLTGEPSGCLMVNSAIELARGDEGIASRCHEHFALLEEIFLKALSEARETGEIRTQADLRAVARFLLNNARGLRVNLKYTSDKTLFDDVTELTFSILDCAKPD